MYQCGKRGIRRVAKNKSWFLVMATVGCYPSGKDRTSVYVPSSLFRWISETLPNPSASLAFPRDGASRDSFGKHNKKGSKYRTISLFSLYSQFISLMCEYRVWGTGKGVDQTIRTLNVMKPAGKSQSIRTEEEKAEITIKGWSALPTSLRLLFNYIKINTNKRRDRIEFGSHLDGYSSFRYVDTDWYLGAILSEPDVAA